ncbi:thioredoxin fold domain-containing protein [Pseudoxanthomonas koreensis]|uniref:thioredoxin fold domain-containing protein n=1 Tax=Pseudoxanthomonas koreensis TaxID=266061 RepID=UPI001391C50A|nr:thioredoxin fold domain-containing protein [Pseudoxanthomonas koreensis]KAF1688964.1 disulfide bond formation protein DsbC [Pseudoxanthomonas koreensis]
MSRLFAAALLGAFSLSACAQQAAPAAASQAPAKPEAKATAARPAATAAAGTAEANVLAALQAVAPGLAPEYVGAAPFPGFREVLLGGELLYVSDDGRYLIQSQPFDLQERKPVASEGLMAHRRALLAKAPVEDRIVFAPPNTRHTLTVFTDIECGYCRRMHQQIADYNRLGIAVQYVAFPRMGPASQDFRDMESVWCAGDRRHALSEAKAGQRVPKKQCDNPVAQQYELGLRVGVSGTPAVFTEDGTQLGGYLAPQQMLQALEGTAAAAGGAR